LIIAARTEGLLAVELGDGLGDLAGGWKYLVWVFWGGFVNFCFGAQKNTAVITEQAGVWCRRGVATGGVGSITLYSSRSLARRLTHSNVCE
jgi:hypothetical protein